MGKDSKSLTAKTAENLKWEGKDYKRFDTEGLFLHVKKNGKYWRMKYTFNKKEKLLSFGSLDNVSLSSARIMKSKARELLSQGIDPSIHKQIAKEANIEAYSNTFELIAREWWQEEHSKNVSEDHSIKNLRRLELHIFPFIGNLPISEIGPNDLLRCLQKVANQGHIETAHRIKTICSNICRYAIASERIKFDFTYPLKGRLPATVTKHHAAIIEPKRFTYLLKSIDVYTGEATTIAALKLAPLVFVRPVDLRKAKWEDIHFETQTWEFTKSKVKKRDKNIIFENNLKHLVPLSKQAIEILKNLHLVTGKMSYVFPSSRSKNKPMSNNTIRAALSNLGISNEEMTGHGFRASARTMLEEVLEYDSKYIEMQLAHTVKDSNGTAYNRTKFIKERTEMMQHWADYLDELRNK